MHYIGLYEQQIHVLHGDQWSGGSTAQTIDGK
jgi:hypothetical protein